MLFAISHLSMRLSPLGLLASRQQRAAKAVLLLLLCLSAPSALPWTLPLAATALLPSHLNSGNSAPSTHRSFATNRPPFRAPFPQDGLSYWIASRCIHQLKRIDHGAGLVCLPQREDSARRFCSLGKLARAGAATQPDPPWVGSTKMLIKDYSKNTIFH